MSNEKVILVFLEGKEAHTPTREVGFYYSVYSYKGQTLRTDGNELINYSTRIAYKKDGKVFLNIKKYSVTTSKIQSKISYLAHQKGFEVVTYEEA